MLAQNSDVLHQVTKYLHGVLLTFFFFYSKTHHCKILSTFNYAKTSGKQGDPAFCSVQVTALSAAVQPWIPHKATSSGAGSEWFREVTVGSAHTLVNPVVGFPWPFVATPRDDEIP